MTCMLGRERAGITEPVVGAMDRAEILALARPDHLLDDLIGKPNEPPRIRGEGGRPVCPIPLPDSTAPEIVALALDSSEHGLPAPDHMKMRQAFRVIRDAQAECQRRAMKRVRPKDGHGDH